MADDPKPDEKEGQNGEIPIVGKPRPGEAKLVVEPRLAALRVEVRFPGPVPRATAIIGHIVWGACVCSMLPVKGVPVGVVDKGGDYTVRVPFQKTMPEDFRNKTLDVLVPVMGLAFECYGFTVRVQREEIVRGPA